MNRTTLLLASLVVLAVPALALAQATPTPPPGGAGQPVATEPAPAPEPAPIVAPAPEPTPAPLAAEPAPDYGATSAGSVDALPPPPPPEAEEGPGITGWFRIDSDFGNLQLWAGATHPLSDSIGLASDIYVVGTVGEFDLGITIAAGPALFTPMIGIGFDWGQQKALFLAAPQLFTIVDTGGIYFESWIQLFLYDVFTSGVTDYLHLRKILLYEASDVVALGVEADFNIAVGNAPPNADMTDEQTLLWLPIGGHVKLNYGEASTLQLFLGYDVVGDDARLDGHNLAGRFTFVQTW